MTLCVPVVTPLNVRQRARHLMAARGIGRYLEMLGCGAFAWIERRLAAVQEQIYYLDALGESSARPGVGELRGRWRAIFRTIRAETGVGFPEGRALTRELRVYQQLELDRRCRLSPWALTLGDHYRLKTCDVRMQRRLCGVLSGHMPSPLEHRQWEIFDVLSEMLDDIDDRQEDWGTFNYNRFADELGAAGTTGIHSYLAYIRELEREFPRTGGKRSSVVSLFEETAAALEHKCGLLVVRRVA